MSAHHLLWSLTTAGLNCKKASADSCLHKTEFLQFALFLPPQQKANKLRHLTHVTPLKIGTTANSQARVKLSVRNASLDPVYVSTLRRVGNPETSPTLASMSAATSLCGDFLRQAPAFKNTAAPNSRRPKQTTPRAPGPSLPCTPSLHSCDGFPPFCRCGFETCHMHAPSDSRTAASLTVPAEMSAHHLLWSLTTARLNCKKASADTCLHKTEFLQSALFLPPRQKANKLRHLTHVTPLRFGTTANTPIRVKLQSQTTA